MAIRFISIEEFSEICGEKVNTIKKRYKEIPGIVKTGNTYQVQEGTRYPVDKRRIRIRTGGREAKAYYLLRTISEEKYIASDNLGLYQEQFDRLLTELFISELIQNNELGNEFGANSYDITPKGSAVLLQKKEQAIKQIVELVADAGGTFFGAAYAAANR